MNNRETIKLALTLNNTEKNFIMSSAINRLKERKDYFDFTEELRESMNNIECRYNNSYKKLILQIWDKYNEELDSESNVVEKFETENSILCDLQYRIVNEMSKLIVQEHLSYIEAWEIIREKLIDGEYSLSNFRNLIG